MEAQELVRVSIRAVFEDPHMHGGQTGSTEQTVDLLARECVDADRAGGWVVGEQLAEDSGQAGAAVAHVRGWHSEDAGPAGEAEGDYAGEQPGVDVIHRSHQGGRLGFSLVYQSPELQPGELTLGDLLQRRKKIGRPNNPNPRRPNAHAPNPPCDTVRPANTRYTTVLTTANARHTTVLTTANARYTTVLAAVSTWCSAVRVVDHWCLPRADFGGYARAAAPDV
ncbi:hypothetical protein GCM10009804_17030 [Kribbella hippodromi]|uniref:Uncharacterized protein n=1 Tax=Kribbella hippodromi TaxID=434347 RepID=A0ABN2CNN8_9ACTN